MNSISPHPRNADAGNGRVVIDPSAVRSVYPLLGSLVVPRPIAWVSSRSASGVDNLAPHSFFTIVSTAPPIIVFSSMGEKDTVRNIRASGEFVVCGSPAARLEQINLTGVEFGPDISEFDATGLTREPSQTVAAARVAESPYALECRLVEIKEMGNGLVVFGEVTCIAVDESVLVEGRVAIDRLDPIARLGGNDWSRIGEITTRRRLSVEEYMSGM
jgi:flavin reductase (DIM6/NTAB) family NADH-FMN oxidoreductase RutF